MRELTRVLRSQVRILGQQTNHERVETRWNSRAEFLWGPWNCGVVLVQDRCRQLAGERRAAGQELVEHAAQRVDVRAGIRRMSLAHLGSEIRSRPEHDRRLGEGSAGGRTSDSEVQHLH